MTESDFSKQANRKRTSEFLIELKALLKKHKAEIVLEEDSRGWNGSTYHLEVQLEGYTVGDVEYVHGSEIIFGSCIDGGE